MPRLNPWVSLRGSCYFWVGMKKKPCLGQWDRHVWKALPNTRQLCERPGCMKLNPRGIPTFVRFWDHVELQGDCWIYTGQKNGDGYGLWTINDDSGKRNVKAHRYSFFLYYGYLPYGEDELDHTCDHRACVNPDHLSVKTHQKNTSRIKNFHFAKLNRALAEEIRKLIGEGEKVNEIAKRYGVSAMTVYRICSGATWKIDESPKP